MTRCNVFTLNWEKDKRYRHGLKWYAYGHDYPIICPVGQIPSFQLPLENDDHVTAFYVTNLQTGVKTDIIQQLVTFGIGIHNRSEGFQLEYNSIFPISGFESTYYELEMIQGDTTWYSEVLQFVNVWELDRMIKIEYSNAEKLCYDGGAMYYENGFKNWVYIDSTIAKPERKIQERVKEVNGRIFPLQQVTWKEHRFTSHFPEFLIDALSLITLHDFVTIKHEGKEFNVSRFLSTIEWEDRGDIAVFDASFRTDTVISNNGRAIAPQIALSQYCVTPNYSAKNVIQKNGTIWDNGFGFINGDFAVVLEFFNSQIYRLYKRENDNWTLVPLNQNGIIVRVISTNQFWFSYGFILQQPKILSFDETAPDTYTVKARTIPNIYNRVVVRRTDSSEVVIHAGILPDPNGFITHSFNLENVVEVSVQPYSDVEGCDNFQPSDWFVKEITGGISVMGINSTFTVTPELPATAPLTPTP